MDIIQWKILLYRDVLVDVCKMLKENPNSFDQRTEVYILFYRLRFFHLTFSNKLYFKSPSNITLSTTRLLPIHSTHSSNEAVYEFWRMTYFENLMQNSYYDDMSDRVRLMF